MDGAIPSRPVACLRLREACERYGVTKRTLIYYETLELISPRRVGQDRVYDRQQQRRIEFVLRGRRFRLKLEVLRQLLELYDTAGPEAQRRRWHEVLAEQARALSDERRHIGQLTSEIQAILSGIEDRRPG